MGITTLFLLIRFESLKRQKKNLESIVNDRTQQLQEANIELKEINATKDKFVSIIAHDIMNPFNAILGFSELLVNNRSWPEKRKSETATMIFDSSRKLYDLLENLLKWSKSEGGLLKFTPQILNIKKIIKKNYSVLKPAAKAKDINLSTRYSEGEIEVYSDPQIIDTILRNLVSNAIKFTHPNGNIHINIGTLDNFAHISIIDNGIGISDENIKKIVGNDNHQST
ncbi:MAG: HAMP domain-containing sensor histidine kinase, partial [Prolixibacteraceae bacterium]|nr:HAMP domain-containing sensor histidine kinase [Prolixibacteraceae bacterium]